MTLHATDEVIAVHHIGVQGTDCTVRRGTLGVVLKHWKKTTPTYRVKFRLPGFPGRAAIVDDLTDKDVIGSGTLPDRLHGHLHSPG